MVTFALTFSCRHMDLFSELRTGFLQEASIQGPIVPFDSFSERIRARIPADSPLLDLHTLAEIADYVRSNVLIPIDARRTHAVLGSGNPDADLVLIGEAPGEDEDLQGLPFVGRAGKLLTKILAAIDVDRDEVYITNILKTRPPRNRNPSSGEISAHIPILYRQLSVIKPKILCCLGRIAGNAMLDCTLSLSEMRKRSHQLCGIPLMVTYHPAALLRNPQWKRPTWTDVQQLRDRYRALQETQ